MRAQPDGQLPYVSHEVFLEQIRARILTDEEIAAEITRRSPKGAEHSEIVQAVRFTKGGGAVTGPIRTAIRALHGLDALPEDLEG